MANNDYFSVHLYSSNTWNENRKCLPWWPYRWLWGTAPQLVPWLVLVNLTAEMHKVSGHKTSQQLFDNQSLSSSANLICLDCIYIYVNLTLFITEKACWPCCYWLWCSFIRDNWSFVYAFAHLVLQCMAKDALHHLGLSLMTRLHALHLHGLYALTVLPRLSCCTRLARLTKCNFRSRMPQNMEALTWAKSCLILVTYKL